MDKETSLDPSIWVAVIGAITGALGWFGRWILTRPHKRRIKRWRIGYEDIHSTYEALTEIVRETSAKRSILIKYENGGGIPRPGHSVYITIIYEVQSGETPSIKDQWQKREANDLEYFKFLRDLMEKSRIHLITEDLVDGSLLKTAFVSYDVGRAETYLIHQNTDVTYVLCNHFESAFSLTPHDEVQMDSRASDLRNLFQKRN